jgi:hypothetical protein
MAIFIVLPWLVPGLHIIDRLVIPPVTWLLGLFEHLALLIGGPGAG